MEEDVYYIYAFSKTQKVGKVFKSEIDYRKWADFIWRLVDVGCDITCITEAEFNSSYRKHYVRPSTYESLYTTPF
jgi:hypothetical protein